MQPTFICRDIKRRTYILLALAGLLLFQGWLSQQPAMAHGTRDPAFGNGGRASVNFGPTYPIQVPSTVSIQPDGRIIVGGVIRTLNNTPDTTYVALIRFNNDGSLDTTFGNGGKVIMRPLNRDAVVIASAVQSDGKILLAGYTYVYIGETSFPADVLLIRYNPNGSLDNTFGNSGIVITDLSQQDAVTDMMLQSDGKIVVTGYVNVAFPGSTVATMVRYNNNGAVDSTFGSSGVVQLNAWVRFVAITIQTDGKIVVGGQIPAVLEKGYYLLARYTNNGNLDGSFGNNGLVSTEVRNGGSWYGRGLNDLTLQPDGKIIAAGYPLIRYLSNGSIDPGFPVPYGLTGYYYDFVRGFGGQKISLQSNGRIVVTWPWSIASSNDAAGLARSDGGLVGITVRSDFGVQDCPDVAVQPDDKIILIGKSFFSNEPGFVIARYQTISSLAAETADFVARGKTDIGVYRPSSGTWYAKNTFQEFQFGVRFGMAGDYVCPADYDGDGRTDLVVWRPPSGDIPALFCYEYSSPPYSSGCLRWGLAGDVPVGGDFDGDTLSDMTVFRQGVWHVLRSSDGSHQTVQWGVAGDKPVPGDYDADGITDVAVFRPGSGTWYVRLSSSGSLSAVQLGLSTDQLVQGDYDGDGRTDFAVFRAGTWYIQQNTAGVRVEHFGLSTDRPIPGDYDADGRTDIAVFRDGTWYLLESTNGFRVEQYGQAGDIPLSPGYVDQ